MFALTTLGCYFFLKLHFFSFSAFTARLPKLSIASFCIVALLILSRFAQYAITRNVHGKAAGYNIVKVIGLATFVVAALVVISFLNANWYAAAASLGIASLILGFALQTPIASLLGINIVVRSPFKIGHHIHVKNFTGDVVEINYLDITLWEFAGYYLSNDVPIGRLIKFSNSMVFQDQVYNYSWNKFSYI